MASNLIKIFQSKISLSEKSIRISYDISKEIPIKIFHDQHKIKQILFNLLSNSFKFTINGSIHLEINIKDNFLIFIVKDTGKGVKPKYLKELGQPFFRSESFNNNFGIGMGLHIVQKNIKDFKGEFTIESNFGYGTIISAKIPFNDINKDNSLNKKYEQDINQRYKNKFVFRLNSLDNGTRLDYGNGSILDNENGYGNGNTNENLIKNFFKNNDNIIFIKKKESKTSIQLPYVEKNNANKNFVSINKFPIKKRFSFEDDIINSKINSKNKLSYFYKENENNLNRIKGDLTEEYKENSDIFIINKNNLEENQNQNQNQNKNQNNSSSYDFNSEEGESSNFISPRPRNNRDNSNNNFTSSCSAIKNIKIKRERERERERERVKKYLSYSNKDNDMIIDNNIIKNNFLFDNDILKEKDKYKSITPKKKNSKISLKGYKNYSLFSNNNNYRNINKSKFNSINKDQYQEKNKYKESLYGKSVINPFKEADNGRNNALKEISSFEFNSNYKKSRSNSLSKQSSKNVSKSISISKSGEKYLDMEDNTPKIRILLVDDEKLIRQSEINVIRKFFMKNKKEYEIEECTDGIECLYKLYQGINQGKKYDIIFTDETMNFMKGSTMSKIIRNLIKDNILYNLSIYMVTSYESSTIPEITKKDIDKIFTKPLSLSMLDNIIDFNL
jgi:CheY-like chemotaxis protein